VNSEATNNLEAITRENVGQYIVRRLHEGRSIAQANIELIELSGKKYILKDFSAKGHFVRNIWGRRIIAREARVYRRLQGIPGIPKVLKKLGDFAFIMELVEGDRIPHRRDSDLTPDFFKKLKKLISGMHKRGITHGDLRRKNILVGPGKQPWLIDFAGSFCLKKGGNVLTRAIFRRLKKVDEITVIKIQNHLLPGTLLPEEEERLSNVPWYLKLGWFFKKKIYRPFKHATRKNRKR
jgi:tRNA A-37 threonylcarbamoyl transferase component Bud32